MRRKPPYHSLQWRHLPPDASFIAHLSHANRQPQGTASNVTGLPHLQVVISACSFLTTAVAITRGTGGQNRVGAALPPVLCLSYASPRSMGSQTELRQSTICMQGEPTRVFLSGEESSASPEALERRPGEACLRVLVA